VSTSIRNFIIHTITIHIISIRHLRVKFGCQVVDRPWPRARDDTVATSHGGVATVAFHGVRLTQLDIGVRPTTFEFVCMRVVANACWRQHVSCVAAVAVVRVHEADVF